MQLDATEQPATLEPKKTAQLVILPQSYAEITSNLKIEGNIFIIIYINTFWFVTKSFKSPEERCLKQGQNTAAFHMDMESAHHKQTKPKCTAQSSPNRQVIYQLFPVFPDTPALLYSQIKLRSKIPK